MDRDELSEPPSPQLAPKPGNEAALETLRTLDGDLKVPPCALKNLVTCALSSPHRTVLERDEPGATEQASAI
jgi:hypothetical protein